MRSRSCCGRSRREGARRDQAATSRPAAEPHNRIRA
jgi:hypothetical protein